MRKIVLANRIASQGASALSDFTDKKVANSLSDAREGPASQGFIVGNRGGTIKVPGKRGWIYMQRVVPGGENVLLQCYVPVDENGEPRGHFYAGATITPTATSDTNPTYYTYDELPVSPMKTKRVPLCNYEYRRTGTFSNDSGLFFGDPTGAFVRGYAPDQVPVYTARDSTPGAADWLPGPEVSGDCIETKWRVVFDEDHTFYEFDPNRPFSGHWPDFVRRNVGTIQYEGAVYGGSSIRVPSLDGLNIPVGSRNSISQEELVYGYTMQKKHWDPGFRFDFHFPEAQPPYPVWHGFTPFWIEVPDAPAPGPGSGLADPNYYSDVGTFQPAYMPSQPAAVTDGQLWNDGASVLRFDAAIKAAARAAGNTSPDAGWEIVSGQTSAIFEEYSVVGAALASAVTATVGAPFDPDNIPYYVVWRNLATNQLELASQTNLASFGRVAGVAVGFNADGSRMRVMTEGLIASGGTTGHSTTTGVLYMGPSGQLKIAFENLIEGGIGTSTTDTTIPVAHDSNKIWQPMGFSLGGQDLYIRVGEAVLR